MTTFFLFFELKDHCQLKQTIDVAENYFVNKEYSAAMHLYKSLMLQYDSFKLARSRVIQCCFVLAENDLEFYDYGLSFVKAKMKFHDSEIEELARYLPNEYLKIEFRSIFVKA